MMIDGKKNKKKFKKNMNKIRKIKQNLSSFKNWKSQLTSWLNTNSYLFGGEYGPNLNDLREMISQLPGEFSIIPEDKLINFLKQYFNLREG